MRHSCPNKRCVGTREQAHSFYQYPTTIPQPTCRHMMRRAYRSITHWNAYCQDLLRVVSRTWNPGLWHPFYRIGVVKTLSWRCIFTELTIKPVRIPVPNCTQPSLGYSQQAWGKPTILASNVWWRGSTRWVCGFPFMKKDGNGGLQSFLRKQRLVHVIAPSTPGIQFACVRNYT